MIFTIDPYYDIDHFNRTLESLKNNKVPYEVFVDSSSPFNFYIEQPMQPVFLDFDMLNTSRERSLVSIVKPLTPQMEYKYLRRNSHSGKKGFEYYAMNDYFEAIQKTKEGIVLHMSPEMQFKLSKKYPRKIWFMGRYLNNTFTLFQVDSLLVKNYLSDITHRVIQEQKGFQHSTILETEINYKHFQFRDRIVKLEESPYLLNGRFVQPRVRNEYGRKFLLEHNSNSTNGTNGTNGDLNEITE